MAIDKNPAKLSPLEEVNLFLDQAFDRLKLDDGIRELLRRPWRELTVALPVTMDDGRIEVFSGYRVQHNGVRGPYKGGVRYDLAADKHEVAALASLVVGFILMRQVGNIQYRKI